MKCHCARSPGWSEAGSVLTLDCPPSRQAEKVRFTSAKSVVPPAAQCGTSDFRPGDQLSVAAIANH